MSAPHLISTVDLVRKLSEQIENVESLQAKYWADLCNRILQITEAQDKLLQSQVALKLEIIDALRENKKRKRR